MRQMRAQRTSLVISPVAVNIKLYAKDNRLSDLDNKSGSILDLATKSGVIEDDNWSVVRKLEIEYMGVDRQMPRAEVEITTI